MNATHNAMNGAHQMQTAINIIGTAKDISLDDVLAIVGATLSAIKASNGSHLQAQQVVLDSLCDLSCYLQDKLTEQEHQSALETVEWVALQRSMRVAA